MRTLSFILAFAVTFAVGSIAGPVDGNLPGTGTFSYGGSPIVADAVTMVVAVR